MRWRHFITSSRAVPSRSTRVQPRASRSWWPGSVRLLVTVALLLGVLGAEPASSESDASKGGRVQGRVIVLALPHLSWDDVGPELTPHLWSVFDQSALASVSLKVERRSSDAGDVYATMSAGTRALAPEAAAALVLAPDEPYGIDTAADEFARRTGDELDGAAGVVAMPDVVDRNDRAKFGGEVGLVAEELEAAGWRTAVLANADVVSGVDGDTHVHREAALALVDRRGVLGDGVVDPRLTVEDATVAGYRRLDVDRVVTELNAVDDHHVVLIEASDLRRAVLATEEFDDAARDEEWAGALERTDELVAAVLQGVDPERDAVVVLTTAAPPGVPRLGVAALLAPGVPPSFLSTGQTRRNGYVTVSDVGPTLLDLAGAEVPATMEGRPFEVGGDAKPITARVADLRDGEDAARFRDRLVAPITNLFIAMSVALLVAALVSLWRRGGVGRSLRASSFVVLVFPVTTYLAGLLPLHEWGTAAYLGATIGGALVVGIPLGLVASSRPTSALHVALGLAFVVIVGNVVLLDSALQFNTVFGDSPIVAGRFGGINNVTFALLMATAIMVAGLMVDGRTDGRRRGLALGLVGVAVVVDVVPAWGADVGGILAGVPGVAITVLLLAGVRIRFRTVVLAGIGTAAAVGVLAAFDLSRPSGERTHLGRLFERIATDGAEGLWLPVSRKLEQNLAALTGTLWLVVVIATALSALAVWAVAPGTFAAIGRRYRTLRPTLWGLGVVGVLGFALNDSGIAVPGMMLAVVNPVVIVLLSSIVLDTVPAGRAVWSDWWETRPRAFRPLGPAPSMAEGDQPSAGHA